MDIAKEFIRNARPNPTTLNPHPTAREGVSAFLKPQVIDGKKIAVALVIVEEGVDDWFAPVLHVFKEEE